MASSPISSWQIEGEKVEAVTDFFPLGSKITADGDCSHEIKRHSILGRKAMANLDSLLKKQRIKILEIQSLHYPVTEIYIKAGPLFHVIHS